MQNINKKCMSCFLSQVKLSTFVVYWGKLYDSKRHKNLRLEYTPSPNHYRKHFDIWLVSYKMPAKNRYRTPIQAHIVFTNLTCTDSGNAEGGRNAMKSRVQTFLNFRSCVPVVKQALLKVAITMSEEPIADLGERFVI